MSFSLGLAIVAVAVNLIVLLFLTSIQQSDYIRNRIQDRHSIILGTNQKFLWMQDFYSHKYGDTIGLSAVAVVFTHLWKSGLITSQMYFWGGIFGVAVALVFWLMCIAKTHKPDWGYPEVGRISLGGVSQLIYLAIFLIITFIVIWNFAIGNLKEGYFWIPAILGIICYAIMWLKDLMSGNFDPLQKS